MHFKKSFLIIIILSIFLSISCVCAEEMNDLAIDDLEILLVIYHWIIITLMTSLIILLLIWKLIVSLIIQLSNQ